MARLPQPGSDSGTWGNILNDYLGQAHTSDGSLKDDSVTANTLAPNSVTSSAIAPNSVTNASIASDAVNASSIADGSIVNGLLADGTIQEAKLSSVVQAKLNAPPAIPDGSIAKTKLDTSIQTSLDKADTALQTAPVTSVAGKTGNVLLAKGDVGLTNVDNTSDATKNSAAATLVNKTINGSNNTITNVSLAGGVTGILPVASGGTGSSTQNFVDLTTGQNIAGAKIFSSDITTGDNFNIGNSSTQRIRFSGGTGNHGMEIGRNDGAASTPFIDFHSGAASIDYDSRLIASGGNGTVGQGTLTANAAQFVVNGQLQRNTDLVGSSTYGTNTNLTTASKSVSFLNATNASFSVTLPSTTTAGLVFTFKKIDSSNNAAYVNPPAGGAIEGNTGTTAVPLVRTNDFITVISTTTDGVWNIVGGNVVAVGVAQTDGGVIARAPLNTISPEIVDQFVHMPNLFNDIMWNRQRGGTLVVTKNGTDLGIGTSDQAFTPDSTFISIGSLISTDVIQATVNLCKTFQYTTQWGIVFTGSSWQPSTTPVFEVWKDDVAAWQTLSPKRYAQGNLYMIQTGYSVTASKLRITINGAYPTTNSIRISSIFALGFASDLLSAGYLPRGGGQIYGKTGIATTTAPSTAMVRIGDDTTTNAGGLQFGSDTYLYRQGANQLRTPGEFLVSGRTQMLGAVVYNPVIDTTSSVVLTTSTVSIHYANAASNAMTYTLPSITAPGYVITIKKIDSSANTVTILGTIDGATNYVLTSQYQTANLVSTTTSGVWYLTAVTGTGGSGSYVDLSSAQTVGGVKSFTSAPKLTTASTAGQVWTATGADGSGGWAATVSEKGNWAASTVYQPGNIVTVFGRRWQCVVAHTSGAAWDATNWLLLGQVNNEYSLLPAGVFTPTEHIRMGSPTYGQYTASQNAAAGVRFGIGRTCTITAISFETTTATTTPTIDVQFYSLNRSTNTLSSPAILLGTISAASLNTPGIKTLSVNLTPTAGDDLVIALCARGTTGPVIKSNAAVDPAYFSIGQVYGQTGWNGTNSLTSPTTGSVPLILLQAT